VDLAAAESIERALVTARPAHGVAVHAPHRLAWELAFDLRLQLLRAHALIAHLSLAAHRTTLGRRLLVAAVMAEHDVPLLVEGQRQVAELALLDVAARRAEQVRCKAAAIEQE